MAPFILEIKVWWKVDSSTCHWVLKCMIYKESLFTSLDALWSNNSQFDFLNDFNDWFLITSTPRKLTWKWKITIFDRRYMGFSLSSNCRPRSLKVGPRIATEGSMLRVVIVGVIVQMDFHSWLAYLQLTLLIFWIYDCYVVVYKTASREAASVVLLAPCAMLLGRFHLRSRRSSDTLCNPMNHRWACGLVVQGWFRGALWIFDSMFAKNNLPPLKQIWQWKIHHLKTYCIYFLLKMGNFPSLC